MGAHSGSKIENNGLVFMLDPGSFSSVHPIGTHSTSVNPFTDPISNYSIIPNNYPYVTGKTYYTAVGLTYPESSQAAPWTSRQGLTPGIQQTTGTKTYDHTRDLGMFVWLEKTNTFLSSSYFNGERLNGHVYDTYDGQPTQHLFFQQDYDRIKAGFPDAIFIIIGSHAAENNDNDPETLKRLKEIGLPDSHIGSDRPEYVLIGKPNQPNTWRYIRENINSAIGYMNIGLPFNVQPNRGIRFQNSQYFDLPANLGYTANTGFTAIAWHKHLGTPAGGYHIVYGGGTFELSIPTAGQIRTGVYNTAGTRFVSNHGSGLNDGAWHQVAFKFDPASGGIKTSYIDGINVGTQSGIGTLISNGSVGDRTIGRYGSSTTYYWNGEGSAFLIYNRPLSDFEIKKLYDTYKNRFTINGILENLQYTGSSGSVFLDNGWSGNFGGGNTSGTAYNSGQFIQKNFTLNGPTNLIINSRFNSLFTNRNIRIRVINTSTGVDIYNNVQSWSNSGIIDLSDTVNLGSPFNGTVTIRYEHVSTFVAYHSGILITQQ